MKTSLHTPYAHSHTQHLLLQNLLYSEARQMDKSFLLVVLLTLDGIRFSNRQGLEKHTPSWATSHACATKRLRSLTGSAASRLHSSNSHLDSLSAPTPNTSHQAPGGRPPTKQPSSKHHASSFRFLVPPGRRGRGVLAFSAPPNAHARHPATGRAPRHARARHGSRDRDLRRRLAR